MDVSPKFVVALNVVVAITLALGLAWQQSWL